MFSDHPVVDAIITTAFVGTLTVNSALTVYYIARPIAQFFVSLINKNRLS